MLKMPRRFSDYYRALQIPYDANSNNIRKAYFELAKKYHPDIAGEREATNFRLINEAYGTLIDPEKRRNYDMGIEREVHEDIDVPEEDDMDSFHRYNPDESVYHQLWKKYQDPKNSEEFENKRKEYLKEFRATKLKDSKLYNKMVWDNLKDTNFGVGIWFTVIFIIIISVKSMWPTHGDLLLTKKFEREVKKIEEQQNKEKNQRFNI